MDDTLEVSHARDLGVITQSIFKPSKQCVSVANKTERELFRLRSAISCRKLEVFGPLCTTIGRSHLESCVQTWVPCPQDTNCLRNAQKLVTQITNSQRRKSCNESPRTGYLLHQAPRHLR